MVRNKSVFFLPLLAFVLLCSCSMKQDRMDCPCYVSVQTETRSDCIVTFYSPDGSILERRTMSSEELCSGENYTSIRKGEFYVSVMQGYRTMELIGGRTVSGYSGREPDSLFCFSTQEFAYDDDLLVTGILQKQYARVTIDFSSLGDSCPYTLRVTSPLNSLDLITLGAGSGTFDVRPVVGDDMTASFLMTRQNASIPISLYLYDRVTGDEVSVYDLNTYIVRTGYNWNAEYLGDIRIVFNFSSPSISIEISDWDKVIICTFKI